MFLFHAALSLGMIGLTAGTALYVWGARNEGAGTGFAKLIGLVVIIFSIFSVGCMGYYAMKVGTECCSKNSMNMMAGLTTPSTAQSMMEKCIAECTMNKKNSAQSHSHHS